MPQDSAETGSSIDQDEAGSAARLKEIRARVAELQRRIKTERDPKALAEMRAEVGKLTAMIAELVRAAGGNSEVSKSETVVWPRDLSAAELISTPEWGADPEGLARG